MSAFINVLEEIVFRELHLQIEELRPESQKQINISEVVAYTLNRLPPLFATSIVGYKRQRDYALNELKPQVLQLIKYGIRTVTFVGDPLHDKKPLPNNLFIDNAGVLYQLSKTLNRKYLRWRDLPNIIREMVRHSTYLNSIGNDEDQTIIQCNETKIQPESHVSSRNKLLLSQSKRFKEKRLAHKQKELTYLNEVLNKDLNVAIIPVFGDLDQGVSWSDEKKAMDAMEIEYKALEAYTLQAQLGMINVLEHLIFVILQRMVNPDLYANLNINEVVAYTLNRFPPMYATSDRGFRYLRRKAIIEFSRDLIIAVRSGVIKIVNCPRPEHSPTHFHKFAQEHEQALAELNNVLNREDIALDNVVEIVQALVVNRLARLN
jgi:hypothetical protein